MGRISRQVMFMEMARVAAKRSTCFRLNVGAIVVQDNNPVSIGWNGQASGAPHCAGNDCPGIVPGCCGTIHAEVNALEKAGRIVEGGSDIDLYVTHSPCVECLAAIMENSLRVKRLFFETPYRSVDHLLQLLGPYRPLNLWPSGMVQPKRRTSVYEVTPAGYVVEYFTRQVVELP